MDPNSPRDQDDLIDIERRLAGWRPDMDRLSADELMFAAGQAAARRGPGRILWPAATALFFAIAVGMGVWGFTERTERYALASRIRESRPAPSASPSPNTPESPEKYEPPPPNAYLSMRRSAEQDPNRWLASLQPVTPAVLAQTPEPVIPRSGQRDRFLDP